MSILSSIFKIRGIERTVQTNRQFKYSKGSITLSFGLELSDEQGIRDFLLLLESATKEVETLIEKRPWDDKP